MRVSGYVDSQYQLTLTTDSLLGLGDSRLGDQPLSLDFVPRALDSLSVGKTLARVAVVAPFGAASTIAVQLLDSASFTFDADVFDFADIDSAEDLANFDVVILAGGDLDAASFNTLLGALHTWVANGGALIGVGEVPYLANSVTDRTALDALLPISLQGFAQYASSNVIDIASSAHPITLGMPAQLNPLSFYYPSTNALDPGSVLLGTYNGLPTIAARQIEAGRGRVSGPLLRIQQSHYGESGSLA